MDDLESQLENAFSSTKKTVRLGSRLPPGRILINHCTAAMFAKLPAKAEQTKYELLLLQGNDADRSAEELMKIADNWMNDHSRHCKAIYYYRLAAESYQYRRNRAGLDGIMDCCYGIKDACTQLSRDPELEYSEYVGRYVYPFLESALLFMQRTEDVDEEYRVLHEAMSLNVLGNVHGVMKDNEATRMYCLKGLRLLESRIPVVCRKRRVFADLNHNLAVASLFLKDFDKCIKHMEIAVDAFGTAEDFDPKASSHDVLGYCKKVLLNASLHKALPEAAHPALDQILLAMKCF